MVGNKLQCSGFSCAPTCFIIKQMMDFKLLLFQCMLAVCMCISTELSLMLGVCDRAQIVGFGTRSDPNDKSCIHKTGRMQPSRASPISEPSQVNVDQSIGSIRRSLEESNERLTSALQVRCPNLCDAQIWFNTNSNSVGWIYLKPVTLAYETFKWYQYLGANVFVCNNRTGSWACNHPSCTDPPLRTPHVYVFTL